MKLEKTCPKCKKEIMQDGSTHYARKEWCECGECPHQSDGVEDCVIDGVCPKGFEVKP